VVERYGGIDVLVPNAGGPPAGSLDRFDDDDWREAFDLTLMSAVRLIRGPAIDATVGRWADNPSDLLTGQAADLELDPLERLSDWGDLPGEDPGG
jgi:NAD(P)-dependent dehydrogenase (short-subunit alcohol dehydrogenase family)